MSAPTYIYIYTYNIFVTDGKRTIYREVSTGEARGTEITEKYRLSREEDDTHSHIVLTITFVSGTGARASFRNIHFFAVTALKKIRFCGDRKAK